MNKFTLALLVGFTQSTKLQWPVDEGQDNDFLTDAQFVKKQQTEKSIEKKMQEKEIADQDLIQLVKRVHSKNSLA
jgi:hypothetical protein